MPPLKADYQILYKTDYLQWIETTVERLWDRDYTNVDWENLIEEIEGLGRAETNLPLNTSYPVFVRVGESNG